MTRPRSESRSGASSRSSHDLGALRRALYRPGADDAAVSAYLAASQQGQGDRPSDGGPASEPSSGDAAPPEDEQQPVPVGPGPSSPRSEGVPQPPRSRRGIMAAALGLLCVGVLLGVGLQPLAAGSRTPAPSPTPTDAAFAPQAVRLAPVTFRRLAGSRGLQLAVPWRTHRVRVTVRCAAANATYTWLLLGEEPQTQQYLPVLEDRGFCHRAASYVGPLPGDVTDLRLLISADWGYSVTVEPL